MYRDQKIIQVGGFDDDDTLFSINGKRYGLSNLPHVDVSKCKTAYEAFMLADEVARQHGVMMAIQDGADEIPYNKAMNVPEYKPKFQIGDKVRLSDVVIQAYCLENDPDAYRTLIVEGVQKSPHFDENPEFFYTGYDKFGEWDHSGWELVKVEDDDEKGGGSTVTEWDERSGEWVTRKLRPGDFCL